MRLCVWILHHNVRGNVNSVNNDNKAEKHPPSRVKEVNKYDVVWRIFVRLIQGRNITENCPPFLVYKCAALGIGCRTLSIA